MTTPVNAAVEKPFFVMLNHAGSHPVPMTEENGHIAWYASPKEAWLAATNTVLGEMYGFEVFELGGVMTKLTNEELLWLAQEMGRKVKLVVVGSKFPYLDAGLDLSGVTTESKALLWDVEGWLGDNHGVYIECFTAEQKWHIDSTDFNVHENCWHGHRPKAIQAAVKYLYENHVKEVE